MAPVPPLIAWWTGLLLLATLTAPVRAGAADEALWRLLEGGGQVVLLRHATPEPAVGDPPGFRLDDCATQRNLTDAGRAEEMWTRASCPAWWRPAIPRSFS